MPVKRIFNASEQRTHEKLLQVCKQNGVSVFPKIRVADVLPIESSGISDEEYRYALQAHFDFVVAGDDALPVFAVEFDGPLHNTREQKARDSQKDRLCDAFELPLLRINSRYISQQFRGMDLLTWFIEVWFAREAFLNAQDSAAVPSDEIFDPSFVMRSGRSKVFPYWLSRDALAGIRALKEAGRMEHFAPSYVVGADGDKNYHVLIWLKMCADEWVLIRTGMGEQRFPIVISELIAELGILDVERALQEALSGKRSTITAAELDREIKVFHTLYTVRVVHSCGGG